MAPYAFHWLWRNRQLWKRGSRGRLWYNWRHTAEERGKVKKGGKLKKVQALNSFKNQVLLHEGWNNMAFLRAEISNCWRLWNRTWIINFWLVGVEELYESAERVTGKAIAWSLPSEPFAEWIWSHSGDSRARLSPIQSLATRTQHDIYSNPVTQFHFPFWLYHLFLFQESPRFKYTTWATPLLRERNIYCTWKKFLISGLWLTPYPETAQCLNLTGQGKSSEHLLCQALYMFYPIVS